MSFFIELFCVVTLQYQILVRIAIAYFIIEKKKGCATALAGHRAAILFNLNFTRCIFMIITLETRTADSVRTYFEKANRPEIKQVLPQKAKTG